MNTRVYFYVITAIVLLCFSTRAIAQNDLCTQAIPINCPSSTSGTTVGATLDSGLPTCFGPSPTNNGGNLTVTAPGVWYVIPGTGQNVTADTLTASYDTKISVYTGLNCSALTCVTADDDINATFRSKVAFHTQPGAPYFILVHGFGTATGTFVLNVRCDPGPPNDNCATAQPIGDGSVSGITLGATGERFDPVSATLASCATNANDPVFDVWYAYSASCSGALLVNTCGPFDTLLSVHSSCPSFTLGNQLTPIASTCNDNGPAGCTPGSQLLTVPVTAGNIYLIRVAGAIGANPGGSFLLTTGCVASAPPNDPCSGATVIAGNGSIAGTTANATPDGSSSCGIPGVPDVWYSYTTPSTCGPYSLSFSTCGALDTIVSAYTGACGALAEIPGSCNDNCGGSPCGGPGSCSTFTVPAATTVRIRVASAGVTGNFTLTFSATGAAGPPNDSCASAELIGPGTITRSNLCATTDGASSCGSPPNVGDVWFRYIPPCSYTANINTCGTNDLPGVDLGIDTVLSVHTGCPGTAANEVPSGCSDDFAGAPITCDATTIRDSNVNVALTGGVTYFIRVASFGTGTQGQFRLSISEPSCPVIVPQGIDCWHTECGSTMYEFKNTPIPCGFFDPGSEPFDGTVLLGGSGLDPNGNDTRVRRNADMTFPNVPSTAQVPIEIVALSLVSCQPITVRYCNSPTIETWNVNVGLSVAPPPPPGMMTVTKTHANGGTFISQFLVQPRFTFNRITGGPPATRILDTGTVNPPIPPMQLSSTNSAPWVHNQTIIPPQQICGVNFVPGVQEANAPPTPGSTCVSTAQCCKPVGHEGPGHLHETGHVCTPCPCGACCNPADGSCTELSGGNPGGDCAAAFGGTGQFKGIGSSCLSVDGDSIIDSYEDNNPCVGGTCSTNSLCSAHTDPTRSDSDGDGVPDNVDPAPWNRCIPNPTPLCLQFDHVAPFGDGDCDGDGICDFCAIRLGMAHDCNRNGVPDTCEPDCNNNGVPDDYDLTCGTSVDANGNGKPDECERGCPIGDMNLDEKVDGQDIGPITVALLAGVGGPQFCAVDANANGVSDGGDIGIIVSALLTWPDPVIAGGTYWLVGDLSCNDGKRTVVRPCIPGANICAEWAIRNEGNALNCPVFAQLRNCNGIDQGAPQAIAPGATISIVRCVGNRELVVWCGVTGVQCKISVKFIGFPACPLDQQPCP